MGIESSDFITSHYQELHDQLDHIEHNITRMDMAEHQDQEKAKQDTGYDMQQREPGTSPELQGGKEEESQDAENVQTDMVDVNGDTSALAAQVAQPNSGLGTVGVPAPAQSLNQVFTPHFYQRLPHPLSHLVKELPVVNDTDVNLLCDFMTQVLKIRQERQMMESTIYEIMYPCCRGELLTFVMQAITTLGREFSCKVVRAIHTLQANVAITSRNVRESAI
jgi:hypothetical protein